MDIKSINTKTIGSISINGKSYDVYIAKSKEDKERGLLFYRTLPEDEGMLFINDEPEDVFYHMKNVPFPLDIIGLNEDLKVVKVHHAKANDSTPLEFQKVTYVLEINPDDTVKEGDEADIDDEDSDIVMHVLDPEGNSQMELLGGERIFSRKSTKIIIRKALKAYKSKEDKDYKALGKYIFKELKAQDERKPEFVESPKKD